MSSETTLAALLCLSHELGRQDRGLAILGEGNTSARISDATFCVKASGTCLGTLEAAQAPECRFDALLPLLDDGPGNARDSAATEQSAAAVDDAIDTALFNARVDSSGPLKPSVESIFHAWLLTLPGVDFVGHTHPLHVNSLLASPRAVEYATRRIFPDQVVCCGPSSVLVPYTDPGLALARAIAGGVRAYCKAHGSPPRLVLLGNHGLIALGRTPQAVLAATLMAEKAARIFIGAAQCGGPTFLDDAQVARIAGRSDEHYRQRILKM